MEEAEKGMDLKKEIDEVMGGKDRRVESLGWLTESSLMPKKQKAIVGVGASSIVELRAELYRTQEDVKRLKQGDPEVEKHRARKKTDIFAKKNTGVDDRAHRDKLQLKAVNDGSASYAALEKKSELYDKLVRGELPDEEESEKYSVDFLRKGLVADESPDRERPSKLSSETDEHPSTTSNEAQASDFGMQRSREGLGSNQSYKELIR
ncbi:hypothetical protein O6H91_Y031300 [Diphasiastrum complanatum]|nr:hypothetical protein O6H91_Y031300 [Diphasiastrum complanatum]